jgi:ribose transport system substrate-binding protein
MPSPSRTRRWRFAALAATTISAVALSGCSSDSGSSAADDGEYVIDFANATADGGTYQGLQSTLEEALVGVEGVTLNTYNNNGDATTVFQNLSTMIGEQPDVIVMVNPVADASDRISQQLVQSGIPCIAVNVPIEGCSFFNQDPEPLGQDLADHVAGLMAERGWDGTNTTVIPVETAAYGALNEVLWQFVAPLSEQVPGMEPVAVDDFTTATTELGNNVLQVNTDYSTDAAFQTFATTLQSIPEGQHMVIDCLGDEPCLGAYRALENAGRLDDAMLMAWGATPEAMDLLRTDDAWVAENANFFSSWGEFVGPMALALAKGEDLPEQTFPPQVVVTKDNVDDYFAADGSVSTFPALPDASQYLADQEGILQRFGNVEGID